MCVHLVLKTELNSDNRIWALNILAVFEVNYSFHTINLAIDEIKLTEAKTRKLLTCHCRHHPKADFDRLYAPRSGGGSRLIHLELSYKSTKIVLQR